MKVVHLVGGICSGKSYVRSELGLPGWDIKEDFYIKHGIIKNGVMDWNQFNKHAPHMCKDVRAAYEKAKSEGAHVFIIESSGSGKWINNILRREFHEHIRLILKSPDDTELRKRCEKRGDNYDNIIDFKKRVSPPLGQELTQKEVKERIMEIINK